MKKKSRPLSSLSGGASNGPGRAGPIVGAFPSRPPACAGNKWRCAFPAGCHSISAGQIILDSRREALLRDEIPRNVLVTLLAKIQSRRRRRTRVSPSSSSSCCSRWSRTGWIVPSALDEWVFARAWSAREIHFVPRRAYAILFTRAIYTGINKALWRIVERDGKKYSGVKMPRLSL